MSGLSDVLGGVYNGDDPTPDQHDTTALEARPEVDDEAASGMVWDLDADDDGEDDLPPAPASLPAAPEPAPTADLDADFGLPSATADAAPGAIDELDDAPVWDLDSDVDDPDLDWEAEDALSWDDDTDATDDVAGADEAITSRSFGMLSASAPDDEPEPVDEAVDADAGGGPWLRTDDDILPARRKRSLAFWRRG